MCSVFISWLDLQDATIKMCRLAGYTWRVFAQSIYGYVGTLQYVEIVVAARKYIKLWTSPQFIEKSIGVWLERWPTCPTEINEYRWDLERYEYRSQEAK
jgi:hypothetical protein